MPTRESHLVEEDKPAWTPLKRWNPTQLFENIFHSTSIDYYIARLGEQVGRSTWDEDDEPTDPTEDYTEILLAHARVHRVAHRTEWTSLRVLSLYRLTRLLANFTFSEDRTGDIVSLLRFVFVESEQMKDIQKLLCDYAAWNVEVLMHDAESENSWMPYLHWKRSSFARYGCNCYFDRIRNVAYYSFLDEPLNMTCSRVVYPPCRLSSTHIKITTHAFHYPYCIVW